MTEQIRSEGTSPTADGPPSAAPQSSSDSPIAVPQPPKPRIADINPSVSCVEAALAFYRAGFNVIPCRPKEKITAVKWDPWLEGLSEEAITSHYAHHPEHTVGCIVTDRLLVLDADTPLAMTAIDILEQKFNIASIFVVNTARGQHRYYRTADGVVVRTSTHSTADHPERIDVKAARSFVVLPPTPGKSVAHCGIEHVDDLTVVGQEFVDAVFAHNGCEPPRAQELSTTSVVARGQPFADVSEATLASILDKLDPDMGYERWCRVLMAVHYESAGAEEGFQLVNEWSARGAKYPGERELRDKWRSFEGYTGTPATAGTLRHYLAEQGLDPAQICAEAETAFEVCDTVTVGAPSPVTDTDPVADTPVPKEDAPVTVELVLAAYCVTSSIAQLKRGLLEEVYVLYLLAILGQIAVFYAAPNTGKTLLITWLLLEAIKQGRIDASRLFYINSDDTLSGLIKKAEIAAAHGFHMLADGFQGFENRNLQAILLEVIAKGQARGVILVFDTLKKFTDLMDKRSSSNFMKLLRRFVLAGGTVILLAHTNKKLGDDGKPVYEGTSDVINDADSVYVMRVISPDGAPERVIEFERKKARGNVVQRATFAYSGADGVAYDNLIASVRRVESQDVIEIKAAGELCADMPVIEAIEVEIRSGNDKRMQLYQTVGAKTGCGRRKAEAILDKYCGTDPGKHRWTFTVQERGAKVYALLAPAGPAEAPRGVDAAPDAMDSTGGAQ